MTGVDLTCIDGVDAFTALKVVGEISMDMTRCPAPSTSPRGWAAVPTTAPPAAKSSDPRPRPTPTVQPQRCRLAANALHRSDSALGAFLRRKKAHLGSPKAITATAHNLARIIYSMLRYGQQYVDAGVRHYESQDRERDLRSAERRAAQLGYRLVPIENTQDLEPGLPPATATAGE